jgi:foldase protein PrsA
MTEILTLLKTPLYLIFISYFILFAALYLGIWAVAKFSKMKKKPEWMKLLNQNWFFVFIAFAFLAMITLQAYDMFKDKLPSKTLNGKDVVFVIGDQSVTTDTFYNELYTYYGDYSVFTNLKRAIINTSIATTSEISATVKTQVADLIKQWEDMATYYASYGYTYETIALYYLQDAGYFSTADINKYVMEQVKEKLLQKEYLNAHMDELYPTFATAKKPRVVSHILIAMDDPAKPTAEEAARLQKAKDAIAGGMS